MVVEFSLNSNLPQLEEERVDEYLNELVDFMSRYSYLTQIPILDMLTHPEKFAQVEESFKSLCRYNQEKDLLEFELVDQLIEAVGSNIVQESWSEEVKSFFKFCHTNCLHSYYFKGKENRKKSEFEEGEDISLELEAKYLVKMNLKKIHEVRTMTKFVNTFAKSLSLDTVVDIGSGMGYLSRILAHHYHLNIIGIDGDERQTLGATKLDRKFLTYKGANTKVTVKRYTSFIGQDTLPKLVGLPTQTSLISGLHTCGQLGYDSLDLFVRSEAKGLVSVSCCYHRLDPFLTFPQSQKLKLFSPRLENWVGKLGLKSACQIPFTWSQSKERCREFFKRHFFRALFQKLLFDWNLLPKDIQSSTVPFKDGYVVLGKLPNHVFTTFSTYSLHALNKLNLTLPVQESTISLEQYLDQYYLTNLKEFPKVVLTWSLQSMLAPIVESILLLDRKFFLKEKLKDKAQVDLIPLFDLMLSPRCFALVAHKV